jgi:hypothetical protein
MDQTNAIGGRAGAIAHKMKLKASETTTSRLAIAHGNLVTWLVVQNK